MRWTRSDGTNAARRRKTLYDLRDAGSQEDCVLDRVARKENVLRRPQSSGVGNGLLILMWATERNPRYSAV